MGNEEGKTAGAKSDSKTSQPSPKANQSSPKQPSPKQPIPKQPSPKQQEPIEEEEEEYEEEEESPPQKPKQQSPQKPQQPPKQGSPQQPSQQNQPKPKPVQSSPSPKIAGPRVEKSSNPIPTELQVMIVGLDNAGKSSILSRMKADQQPQNIGPTAGFQVEKFQKGTTQLTVFDMAGATSYRSLWDEHLKGCQVLVFVVDSSDRFRMVVVREELENLMEQPDMRSVPLLIFANKNDLPNALNYSKVSEQLGLEEISDRSWNIVSSSAKTGAGISEGVDWVLRNYKRKNFE